MKRALFVALGIAACTQYRSVGVTFGEEGEGLDGFLCKDSSGRYLLDRGAPDAGLRTVSIVSDVVGLAGGKPGCRTGQLIRYCQRDGGLCNVSEGFRVCNTVDLPAALGSLDRELVREAVRTQLRTLSGKQLVPDTPDEHVILRMVATLEPCSTVQNKLDFDNDQLIGCVYSCPTLFDRTNEDVYLGFETLVGQCDQGVRICASRKLNWQQ